MSTETGKPPKGEPQAAPDPHGGVDCLCMGLGPQLTALLKGVVSPETVAEQWKSGQLETLKLLRALIDHRISTLSGPPPPSRGTKLTVE